MIFATVSVFLLGALGAGAASQACPALPNPLPAPTDLPIIDDMPNPFQFFNNKTLRSQADWECRKAELKTLVQVHLSNNPHSI